MKGIIDLRVVGQKQKSATRFFFWFSHPFRTYIQQKLKMPNTCFHDFSTLYKTALQCLFESIKKMEDQIKNPVL